MFTKAELTNRVEAGDTIRTIAEAQGCNPTVVRYWLKKFNLTTKGMLPAQHLCSCGETSPSAFYRNRKYICKRCDVAKVRAYRHLKKQRALALKGGKCIRCGYNKYYGALDFHHRDPGSKDMDWTVMSTRSWASIVKELEKCDILCANCHREAHEVV